MSKKVLIVEDYDDTRDFMSFLVNSFGYTALTAANGNEAVEIAQQQAPDLIFMDLAMPEMDGLTAIETIRKSSDIPKMPIVAITAHGYLLAYEALQAGCDDVIDKPLDFEKLEPLLNEYLGH
jgi:two-component system, cell cycle response regulator DivK